MEIALNRSQTATEQEQHASGLSDLQLLEELRLTQQSLQRVEGLFNLTSDEDLTESFIYESNALASRYRFLLRLAKARGLTLPPHPDRPNLFHRLKQGFLRGTGAASEPL